MYSAISFYWILCFVKLDLILSYSYFVKCKLDLILLEYDANFPSYHLINSLSLSHFKYL